MSTYYSFKATIDMPYTKQSIIKILNHGKNIGFVYEGKVLLKMLSILESYDAVTEEYDEETDTSLYGPPHLRVTYEDTCIYLAFKDNGQGNLNISFGPFGDNWNTKNTFNDIDANRYLRVLLKLCSNVKILKLTILRW